MGFTEIRKHGPRQENPAIEESILSKSRHKARKRLNLLLKFRQISYLCGENTVRSEDGRTMELMKYATYLRNMEYIFDSLVGDLWSFHLAIIGIMVSVMTLIYTSLCNKVEELNSIRHSKEYALMNRATAVQNAIGKLRALNRSAMRGFIFASLLFIVSSVLKYLPAGSALNCLITIDALLTLGILIYGALFAHDVYSQYQTETA